MPQISSYATKQILNVKVIGANTINVFIDTIFQTESKSNRKYYLLPRIDELFNNTIIILKIFNESILDEQFIILNYI